MSILAGVMLIVLGLLNLLAAIASMLVSRPFARFTASISDLALPTITGAARPFVSVHVAAHDEPPEMVIATIDALLALDYPAFEIIVIDNNTPDPKTWRPVADHAAASEPKVRFFHFDGVRGAKAGALNLALELSDTRTEYVAIVDADYQVAPDFLSMAVAACGPVQFVQFPQAYRRAEHAPMVVAELADYFQTFPREANRAQAPLLTGTLSLISRDALRRAGGWPSRSITEDAELGVRLWIAGDRGLFIDREVGQGMLPLDLAGLRLQRRRWVSGNLQTLLGARRAIRGPGALAVVAQLTAWLGLMVTPLAILVAIAIERAVRIAPSDVAIRLTGAAERIAAITIAFILAGHLVRALRRRQIGSVMVTMALLWTSSFGWLGALRSRPLPFHRTPKSGSSGTPAFSIDTIGSVVALLTAVAFLTEGSVLTAAVLALSATGLLTAPLVDRSLQRAGAQSERMCKA